MTRGVFGVCALAALASCSFDTASLTSGNGRDAAPDIAIDDAMDVPTDVGTDVVDVTDAEVGADGRADVVTDAGRSAVGLWRITRVQVLGATTMDTGTTRVNGLVDIRPASIGVSYTTVVNDRLRLTHNVLACPTPRTLDAQARGAVGLLDDTRSVFTITEGTTPPTFNFRWMSDEQIQATYHNVIDVTFTLVRLGTVTPRSAYAASFQVWFTDEVCREAPGASMSQKAVLLWENAAGGPAIPAGPPSALVRMNSGIFVSTALTSAMTLSGRPPMDAIGMADGVSAAIAYLVVFDDANNNNALDHAYTGASGDTVLGVSNVAIAWRGGVPLHTGTERSSFINTYEGYQTVVIGPDSRSDGGSASWLVDGSTNAPHAGCFAEDPTRPFIAGGLVQATAERGELPRLLR